MKKIYQDIQKLIQDAIKENLPDVSPADLEDNGKIFYMNGKNGTEFDWFINEHLPSFMVFYNDKDNLGAAKATVYSYGSVNIYIYGNHGQDMIKEINTYLDIDEKELLDFAVFLRNNTDDKSIWDSGLDNIEDYIIPDEAAVSEFLNNKELYRPSVRRKEIMGKYCIVSAKIIKEGWKPGFMYRAETDNDQDSGWQFMAGDESDFYLNNSNNAQLCAVYSVAEIDPVIINYLDNPSGTSFVRISPDKFEEDDNQKVYMEKWK